MGWCEGIQGLGLYGLGFARCLKLRRGLRTQWGAGDEQRDAEPRGGDIFGSARFSDTAKSTVHRRWPCQTCFTEILHALPQALRALTHKLDSSLLYRRLLQTPKTPDGLPTFVRYVTVSDCWLTAHHATTARLAGLGPRPGSSRSSKAERQRAAEEAPLSDRFNKQLGKYTYSSLKRSVGHQ